MNEASVMSFLPQDLGIVGILSIVSLLAVWFPLYRGMRVCAQARGATRKLERAALKRAIGKKADSADPLAVVMLRVLAKSMREQPDDGTPGEFVLDATKQYVTHEYESNYARLISMYSNLLPPIGFIGTTSGMLVLFLSMHLSNDSLELGALAIALTSSIFALVGFALLEGMKIRIYGRLLGSLDEVTALYHTLETSKGQA